MVEQRTSLWTLLLNLSSKEDLCLIERHFFFLKCVSDAIMTSFLCLCICISPHIITLTLLQKKVAVLPLLCAASLLLASFWTPAASNARLEDQERNQHQDHEPGQHHLQNNQHTGCDSTPLVACYSLSHFSRWGESIARFAINVQLKFESHLTPKCLNLITL